MSLYAKLSERAEAGRPVRVGLIGAGKFGSMFAAQALHMRGVHLMAVADLDVDRARAALARTGWAADRLSSPNAADALAGGGIWITDDALAMVAADGLDVIIEATGAPAAGLAHARAAIAAGRHVVMVNVEADVLAGPLLAAEARAAGVIYSMAYGDQPALIAELVDWARTVGLPVVCAGKGTKYLPEYHASTPDTVWDYYGFTAEQIAAGGFNPTMFNSFLDGTKSAIEMAAVANACDLVPPTEGLAFPPCGVDDLPHLLRPRSAGGCLERSGTVEVVSSLERDGRPVYRDLRWGVYVVVESPGDYTARCFGEYGLKTDSSGRYTAMYKPYHLIGLELGLSVASAALRGEPTGTTRAFNGDVAATAKRDLAAGEMLDGEGGFTVFGRLMPASASLQVGALPLGLAHGVRLKRAIPAGEAVRWHDVEIDETSDAVRLRRRMEAGAATATGVAAQ